MRFHGIMLVRDEADVIRETMGELLKWIDSLTVYDTGSIDGSWEIVQEFAKADERVIAWKREAVCFEDSLRAHPFDEMRSGYAPGDWVGRIDADEVYHIPPPQFMRERVRKGENLVFGELLDFILLPREVRAIVAGSEDLTRPIQERRRHFVLNTFPEPRWFRYRRSMRWPVGRGRPMFAGPAARERIPVRHYRWRTPNQAHQRCALRAAMNPFMRRGGGHWVIDDWRQMGLRPASNKWVHQWAPGTDLPTFSLTNHLAPKWRQRTLQAISSLGLTRLADFWAGQIDPASSPLPLPEEAVARYRELLASPIPGLDGTTLRQEKLRESRKASTVSLAPNDLHAGAPTEPT